MKSAARSDTAFIDFHQYFDIFGNMEILAATQTLAALAQDRRLETFRYLIQIGPAGTSVSHIQSHLNIPNTTLSFHLNALKNAELITCKRKGRHLIYSANYQRMRELLTFLTNDCCSGHPEICAISTQIC